MRKSTTSLLIEKLKHQLSGSVDLKEQNMTCQSQSLQLIYLNSVCDVEKLRTHVIVPFFEFRNVENFGDYLRSLEGCLETDEFAQVIDEVIRGSVLVVINSHHLIIGLKKYETQSLKEASVETTIQGPQTALSEDTGTSINLIRNRYHQPTLRVEQEVVGHTSKLDVFLLYDEQYVDQKILKRVKDKLEQIRDSKETIQSLGELHRSLNQTKRTLFPVFMITERADRVGLNLSQGKIVLLIEGSPYAMILPAVFFDFISSMEDLYQPYWVSKFLLSLRYLGLFISVTLPALYVGITAYNPEIIQAQIAFGVAGSRSAVPYPAYIEVLFMLIMMELLTEASIRLPKTIGSTATTVGGLILGQAATEAGLVSNIMIIIVAAVAISNFVIPINEMSFAMRVVKYVILFITSITGMIGLVVGVLMFTVYLVSLDSFGEPYLRISFSEAKGK